MGLAQSGGQQIELIEPEAGLPSIYTEFVDAGGSGVHHVCYWADIDRAVTLGLGYPRGPLAWGDELGARTVLAILNNLLQETGDPRYRASQWLRRRAELGLSLLHREV